MKIIDIKNLSRGLVFYAVFVLFFAFLLFLSGSLITAPLVCFSITLFILSVGIKRKERWAGVSGAIIFGTSLLGFLIILIEDPEVFFYSVLGFLITLFIFISFLKFLKGEDVKKEISKVPFIFLIIFLIIEVFIFYFLNFVYTVDQEEEIYIVICESACKNTLYFDTEEDCIEHCLKSTIEEDNNTEYHESNNDNDEIEGSVDLKKYKNEEYGFEIMHSYSIEDYYETDKYLLKASIPREKESRLIGGFFTIDKRGEHDESIDYYCDEGAPQTIMTYFNGTGFCEHISHEEVEDGKVFRNFTYHIISNKEWISFNFEYVSCLPTESEYCRNLPALDIEKTKEDIEQTLSTFKFLDN